MKKVTLFTALFFAATLVFATHNRAGEITYRQTGNNTIEATIITYTKTSSFPADRETLTLCWGDGSCEALLRSNQNGEEMGHDFKKNVYIGVHTYAELDNFILSVTDPNRNGAILNINGGQSDLIQFHIESLVRLKELSENETNQSPILLEAPVDVGYVRQIFMHTPNAIDLDGDSIAYEMISPLMDNGIPVPNYLKVNEIGAGQENAYSFDEQTGLFVWNAPQIIGEYNIAIKIKTYKNGELADEIIRDMQILIMPEENRHPVIDEPTDIPEIYEVSPGQTVNLTLAAYDLDERQVFFSSSSEIYQFANKTASFSTSPETPYQTMGNFVWEVTQEDVREQPYQVVFKAVDEKGLSFFKIIQIKVKEFSTGTKELIPSFDFKIFPNPVSEYFHIDLKKQYFSNSPIQVSIYDTVGRIVKEVKVANNKGSISISRSGLQSGIYFLRFQVGDESGSAMIYVQ